MRRLLALLLTGALTLGLAGAAAAAITATMVTHHGVLRPHYTADGLLTILVIGSDLGPPHRPANPLRGRADGVHLLAIDPRARRATIVNFPRDSFIDGRKVNAHLAVGGPGRLKEAMQRYTGIPVDFWVLATFRSVENVVDGMGGIDMVVEQRMNDAFSGSDLHPGPQRIPGWQALAYVRDRKSFGDGDFARSRNHGTLMRYTHAQLRREHAALPELVRLVGLFARNTVSDIPADQLLPLALLATTISAGDVVQIPVPGRATMRGAAAIVELHPGGIFDRIRNGHVGP